MALLRRLPGDWPAPGPPKRAFLALRAGEGTAIAMTTAQEQAENGVPPGTKVRALMRRCGQAVLATRLAAERAERELRAADWPYASLVLVAHDHDASPLLLISDLADHSRNLAEDPRLSLLYDGTAGYRDPLAGARAAVLGRVERCDGDARLLARFLARHPGAELYAGFADFHLYRVSIERAHLVAGFGEIFWLPAEDVRLECRDATALAEAEADIVAHMNEDHADAIAAMAQHLLDLPADGWAMCGVDPEGVDLQREGGAARLPFEAWVDGPGACRSELVRLTERARAIAEEALG